MTSLLQVRDLSVAFRSHRGISEVVKHISFDIKKGEMLALVGESGSGKSVSALSILRLLPPSAFHPGGAVTFDGNDLLQAPEPVLRAVRGKRISMIFQEPMTALNPLHTIGRQIAEIIEIHKNVIASEAKQSSAGSPRRFAPRDDEIKNRVAELLEQVGLTHLAARPNAYPHELSGGERQRVMIAMAIANKPDLLIADEPTTAVDVTTQAKLLALIKSLQRDMKMSVLFITHDLTLVQHMADRVAVMRHGEIVEIGPVKEVFVDPQHDYTKLLIGSEPKGSAVPIKLDAPEILSVQQLKVHFPIKRGVLFQQTVDVVKAVDDISFSLKAGETLGIVGESGSGKSTLAHAILRLTPSSGTICLDSHEIQNARGPKLRALRKAMQIVFQDPFASLNPRMTVRQIIEEGLLVHERQMNEEARIHAIESILTEVGLEPSLKDRFAHEFSGGQRQRIAIARAMVLNPRLVVLDEPTSALDLTVQSQIIALLKDLQARLNLSYIFISHDLRVIRAIAHHIIVLQKGRVVEAAPTQTLFTAPRQEYTQNLLKAAFLLE